MRTPSSSRVSLAGVFFFNDTATTEIYTLSLHDALPIYGRDRRARDERARAAAAAAARGNHPAADAAEERCVGAHLPVLRRRSSPAVPQHGTRPDRKSTRLNSSHSQISYAVFCLKKKIVR